MAHARIQKEYSSFAVLFGIGYAYRAYVVAGAYQYRQVHVAYQRIESGTVPVEKTLHVPQGFLKGDDVLRGYLGG